MENKYNLKPFDQVLVRDGNAFEWQPEIFYKITEEGKYCTLGDVEWNQCIPYEGNEHLIDTADMPAITDLDNNILFGIELKVGYVLYFRSLQPGIVIPTHKGLAVYYGDYKFFTPIKDLDLEQVLTIYGLPEKSDLLSGKVLWPCEK